MTGGFWTTVDTTMKHTTTTTSSSSGLPVSIFPIDNPDLLYHRWEDDIIWDSEVHVCDVVDNYNL